jgi:hypothetical protein
MAYTIKYYLHYGIFGRQLFDTIVSWGTAGKIALAIWIAVTLAELFVLWRIHKKGGCLSMLLVFLVYDIFMGEWSLTVQLLVWGAYHIIRSFYEPDSTPSKPKTPEQLEKDRKDALYYEIANSDELLRCLDRQEQARYIAEAQSLVYDNNVTPQQIESRLSHWEYYRQNPMPGSERYRELYGDD